MASLEATDITPSQPARLLFNQMVARADDLHLNLTNTLTLAVERKSQGHQDDEEVDELRRAAWISQADDGGWLLGG